MTRPLLASLLVLGLSGSARAADSLDALDLRLPDTLTPATAKRPAPDKPKSGGKKEKRAADRRSKKNYGTGQTIAATGVVAGSAGVVALGFGTFGGGGFSAPGQGNLNLAAGLLSVGGLVGSSGALGAAIAVDNANKKATPVVAGALGLTMGIFAPTFFGVGLGLQMPAFSWAAIGTGATSTLLAAVQMRQTDASRPKRWMRARVDPIGRTVWLTGTF